MIEICYLYTDQKEELKQYCQHNHIQIKGDRFIFAKRLDQIIGFGALYNKNFHPYNDYLDLYVSPDFRCQGIASNILKHLKNHQKHRLQCLINAKNLSAIQFLNKNQFISVRTTLDLEIFLSMIEQVNTSKFVTKKLSELNSTELTELKQRIHHNYSKYHQNINPLNKAINAEQLFLHIQKDIDWENSYVLLYSEKRLSTEMNISYIRAYFLVNYSLQDQSAIIFIGGEQEDHIQLYIDFFGWVLNQLSNQFKILSLESDNTDFYADSLHQHLKLKPKNSDYTYIQLHHNHS